MRLFELTEKKKKEEPPKRRNFDAKAVTRKTGAGPHTSNKYNRKEKHKNKDVD